MNPLGPFECPRGLHDQIILPVINHDVSFAAEEFLDQVDVGFHEILVHSLVDVATLGSELNLLIERVAGDDVRLAEVLADKLVRVVMVLGDVIDIDTSSLGDDVVKGIVEGVVQSSPVSDSVLVGGIDDYLFNFRPFLVVDQAQIVGVFTSFCQNGVGVSEAVSNCDSFKAG